jgi:hypothetical protein
VGCYACRVYPLSLSYVMSIAMTHLWEERRRGCSRGSALNHDPDTDQGIAEEVVEDKVKGKGMPI